MATSVAPFTANLEDRGLVVTQLFIKRFTQLLFLSKHSYHLACISGLLIMSVSVTLYASETNNAKVANNANDIESVHLRGIVLPVHQAKLSFARSGRIHDLPAEGDSFKLGQPIAQLDDKMAKLTIAKSNVALDIARLDLKQALHNHAKTARLLAENIVAKIAITEIEFSVDRAKARIKEAETHLAGAHLELASCTITAPFAGVVVNVLSHLGEHINPGQSVIVLADLSELELAVDIPPEVDQSLQPGTLTSVYVNGKMVGQAEVKVIIPLIDAASGLRRVIWRIEGDSAVLAGRYVTLAHWQKNIAKGTSKP